VYPGYTVPVEYDPILSKLITHAQDRPACIRRMIRALRDYVILGVLTPMPFLADILSSRAFGEGETFTDFIDTHCAEWLPAMEGIDLAALAFVVDEARNHRHRTDAAAAGREAYSPWTALGGFRP
jgi:acetyl/propionyl-CoA carboxylase alpha subunit